MCMVRRKTLVYEDGQFKSKLVPIRFDTETIKNFIAETETLGYEMQFLREGVCGLGDFILWAPDNNFKNFLIREVYENEWTSRHTVEQFTKVTKKLQKIIDELEAEPKC